MLNQITDNTDWGSQAVYSLISLLINSTYILKRLCTKVIYDDTVTRQSNTLFSYHNGTNTILNQNCPRSGWVGNPSWLQC